MKKIESLTPEQEALLPVYAEKYSSILFDMTLGFDEDKVKSWFTWLYKHFELSSNTPEIYIVDSPMAICEKVAELNNEPVKWETISYYTSAFNSWISFYKYMYNELDLEDKSHKELFDKYAEVLDLNIFWSACYENCVVVSKNAVHYSRNENFELHDVNRSAIAFADGYELFFVKGVGIEEKLFKSVCDGTFTFEEFIKIDNEEVKAAVLAMMEEKFGNDYVFKFIRTVLTEIDTYVDNKDPKYLEGTTKGMNVGVYTLFKGKIDDIELSYVRCYCPSTDRMFFLCTLPNFNNAKDAIASLYRIPKKLKQHIDYIQRQGERFTTILTDEGDSMVESLSKDELNDLVEIDGDTYFSKMRYEY